MPSTPNITKAELGIIMSNDPFVFGVFNIYFNAVAAKISKIETRSIRLNANL